MSLSPERKKTLIKDFSKSDNDTGSMEVQIALLTDRIKDLTGHLQKNKHDFASKRGLLKLVSQRSKFLNYLERTHPESYANMIKRLKLKK